MLYLFCTKIFSRCYLQLTVSGSSKEDSYGIALYFRGGLFSGHTPDHLRHLQSRLFSDALSLLRSGAAGHGASQNGLGNLLHKFCHLLPVSRAGCLADYRVKKCSGLLQSDYHSYKRGASRYVWLHAVPYRTCNSGCHQPHHEGERHSATVYIQHAAGLLQSSRRGNAESDHHTAASDHCIYPRVCSQSRRVYQLYLRTARS